MRLMQACGIINTQDFCAWDLGLSWSARINYTVIQQKIYKSLKPPKFFFPSCNKLVSHSISPMEKPSISRMLSRSFSGGEMVVTPFSSLSSKMTRADLKESKLCRWVGQQLPDPIEDHKAPSGWQVWKNTSHLEVRVYISVSCENCLLWSWFQRNQFDNQSDLAKLVWSRDLMYLIWSHCLWMPKYRASRRK